MSKLLLPCGRQQEAFAFEYPAFPASSAGNYWLLGGDGSLFGDCQVDGRYEVLFGEGPLRLLQPEETGDEAEQGASGDDQKELRGGDEGVDGQVEHRAHVAVGPCHAGNLSGDAALDRGDDAERGALSSLHENR